MSFYNCRSFISLYDIKLSKHKNTLTGVRKHLREFVSMHRLNANQFAVALRNDKSYASKFVKSVKLRLSAKDYINWITENKAELTSDEKAVFQDLNEWSEEELKSLKGRLNYRMKKRQKGLNGSDLETGEVKQITYGTKSGPKIELHITDSFRQYSVNEEIIKQREHAYYVKKKDFHKVHVGMDEHM